MADDIPGAHGAIIADLGANLVAVLVILIALASLSAGTDARRNPVLVPATKATPLSGQAQSDQLYQRLRPSPDTLIVELTDQGANVPGPDGLVPLADIPDPWPPHAVAFVFSPAHHADFLRLTAQRDMTATEVTVPLALRHPDPRPGGSAFSPAFLSIRAGPTPDSIRPALLRLLTNGPGGASLSDHRQETPAREPLLARITAALHLTLNMALLLGAVVLLRRLHRHLR